MQSDVQPCIPALPLGDSGWRRRQPENSALYKLLARHLYTYLEQAAMSAQGGGVPWFVKRELESFLSCGIVSKGFLRVRCPNCRTDQVVAFSCKTRAFCLSCCARRMADTAAHLVDHVFPDVPIRQWVLTFPFRMRYLLAYNAKLCGAVRKVSIRTLLTFLRRRALKLGIPGGHSGAVCSLQRAGGSINLNVHLHILALDGVFFELDEGAGIDYQHLPAPRETEIQRLLEQIRSRVQRLLRKWGLDENAGPQADADDSGWAACLAQAGRTRPAHLGRESVPQAARFAKRRCAELEGYTLHADTMIPGGDRIALERLARYVNRPPISTERLSIAGDGRVLYRLRTPFHDGTSVLAFKPLPFIARLAALVPPPRFHLLTYHGVLAPNHALRSRVVPKKPVAAHKGRPNSSARPRPSRHPWADLMKRVHSIDVLACDNCGSRKVIVAAITQHDVIAKILLALHLPTEPPFIHPARSDPLLF